jgi:hypothetical protein
VEGLLDVAVEGEELLETACGGGVRVIQVGKPDLPTNSHNGQQNPVCEWRGVRSGAVRCRVVLTGNAVWLERISKRPGLALRSHRGGGDGGGRGGGGGGRGGI